LRAVGAHIGEQRTLSHCACTHCTRSHLPGVDQRHQAQQRAVNRGRCTQVELNAAASAQQAARKSYIVQLVDQPAANYTGTVQGYAATRETTAIVALTTLVTGLAMNYVQRGSYLP